MKVIVKKDFSESSNYVAQEFVALIQQKPTAKLGLATGGSAEAIYAVLAKAYDKGQVDFSGVSSVNLDEYVGLNAQHPQSYRYYMNQHLFDKVNIDKKNTYVPNGMTKDVVGELQLFGQKLHRHGRVDLQLLGVGGNGHIGFNEPSENLVADAHVEDLIANTIAANARYFASASEVPRQAFTQGIGDILKARQIVLIATGATKQEAICELLSHNRVSTMCPVTLLKLHPDTTVVIDEALYEGLTVKDPSFILN